jgi:SAM-dependent methyltransferase
VGNETAKAFDRRVKSGWFDKYLVGSGIDIGCGTDKLVSPHSDGFQCRGWDVGDGDAQLMQGVPYGSFDFVYSSHCLEHMHDPSEALSNWWRILKPGGYLVVIVPCEYLYEQSTWPSRGNGGHKTSWRLTDEEKATTPVSRSLLTEISKLLPDNKYAEVEVLQRVDTNYDYELPKRGWVDQTGGPAEAALEVIVKKVVR